MGAIYKTVFALEDGDSVWHPAGNTIVVCPKMVGHLKDIQRVLHIKASSNLCCTDWLITQRADDRWHLRAGLWKSIP